MTPRKNKPVPAPKRSSLRWSYLGLGLASILWLSTGIIDHYIIQLQEIEQLEDDFDIPENQSPTFTPLQLCRAGALLLATTSITLIGYQLSKKNKDPHQGAKRSTDHEPPSRA